MKTRRFVCVLAAMLAAGCNKPAGGGGTSDGGSAVANAPQPTVPSAPKDTPPPQTAAGGEVGSLPVVTDCPKSLGGSEKVKRTITKACGPVPITSDYYIDGELTLEAGSVLKFAEGTAMYVGESATSKLFVKGTAQEPVVMTSGGDAVAGFWKGLGLGAHAGRSKLEYLTLEHGGDNNGLIRVRCDDVSLKGLVVRDAKEFGLYIDDNLKVAEISGATFEKAGKVAVSVPTSVLPAFATGNKFDADGIVEVRGGDVETDAKWQNPGAPYVLRRGFDVRGKSRVKLEIAAGTELRLDKDAEIDVGYGGPGAMTLAGTADKPVIMTSSDPDAPWKGIWAYNGADASFAFTNITNAGSDDNRGTLFATSGASISLSSVTFKGKGLGVVVDSTGKVKTIEKTTFDASDKPALTLPADAVASLGAGNVFPAGSHIIIKGGKVKSTATWAPQGVPYEVQTELLVDEKGALTLQPGVDLAFDKDQQMSIGYSGEGSLKAQGTPDKPVKLRGVHDETDAWKGLFFYDGSRDSELTNVRVEGANGEAGVIVRENAIVKVDNLTCSKCTNAALISVCKAKLTVGAVKVENGTPKDVIKPENCN